MNEWVCFGVPAFQGLCLGSELWAGQASALSSQATSEINYYFVSSDFHTMTCQE